LKYLPPPPPPPSPPRLGQGGAHPRFNSEAFANLNIALRLVGENLRAVEETWAQLAVLSTNKGYLIFIYAYIYIILYK